jgi:hypothetical protein
MDIFSQFGISPLKFAIQSIVFLAPAVWATIRVARNRTGAALSLWLILVWFLPIIGAVMTLLIVKNNEPRKIRTCQST